MDYGGGEENALGYGGGKRQIGTRRARRVEGVENYGQEMQNKRWRHRAVEREEWTSVIKEAKALRGLQRQGVRKDTPLISYKWFTEDV